MCEKRAWGGAKLLNALPPTPSPLTPPFPQEAATMTKTASRLTLWKCSEGSDTPLARVRVMRCWPRGGVRLCTARMSDSGMGWICRRPGGGGGSQAHCRSARTAWGSQLPGSCQETPHRIHGPVLSALGGRRSAGAAAAALDGPPGPPAVFLLHCAGCVWQPAQEDVAAWTPGAGWQQKRR